MDNGIEGVKEELLSALKCHLEEDKQCISHKQNAKQQAPSVSQPDARPIGNQEVAGSITAGSGSILSWRLIMKYFQRSFSPFW